jgi:putative restriction endonuclease
MASGLPFCYFRVCQGDKGVKKAPHNLLLLPALLDLFPQGQPETNFIELTPDLSDLFTPSWSRIVPPGRKSSVAFPFFHLKNEGFWHLVPMPGGQCQQTCQSR